MREKRRGSLLRLGLAAVLACGMPPAVALAEPEAQITEPPPPIAFSETLAKAAAAGDSADPSGPLGSPPFSLPASGQAAPSSANPVPADRGSSSTDPAGAALEGSGSDSSDAPGTTPADSNVGPDDPTGTAPGNSSTGPSNPAGATSGEGAAGSPDSPSSTPTDPVALSVAEAALPLTAAAALAAGDARAAGDIRAAAQPTAEGLVALNAPNASPASSHTPDADGWVTCGTLRVKGGTYGTDFIYYPDVFQFPKEDGTVVNYGFVGYGGV